MDIPSGSPIIYQASPTFSSNAIKTSWKDRFKSNLPKYIFGVLAMVLVFELIYAIQAINGPSAPRSADATSIIGVAKIVLDTQKQTVEVGDQVPVTVRIVTAGRSTDSTDLIQKYDPAYLDIAAGGINEGQTYKEYVIKDVDAQSGTISVSAITPPNSEGFVGIGTFAVLNFTAKQNGNTKIEVDFQKGSTTDSNIVETGIALDILDQVFNLDLAIGPNNSLPATIEAQSCGGYYQYCQNMVGQVGRQFCKQGRQIENICTFDPKLSVECDICRLGF